MSGIEVNEPVKDPADETTTQKIFTSDCREIGKLARLRGKTIQQVYRDICAPIVRAELREEMQRQAAELGDPIA